MAKMPGEKDVTIVLTSCGRPEELKITLDSFFKFNSYPIKDFIIVEDSGTRQEFDFLNDYPVTVIYNDENIGQVKSIVKAYDMVSTKYIFHLEDDWKFFKSGFIEQSKQILESDKKILQVWIRGIMDTNGHPVERTTYRTIDGVRYRLLTVNHLGRWHGFSFNPGLRRKSDYIPYNSITAYEGKGNSGAEQEIGEYYFKKGFRSAIILGDGFVRHIGWQNSTRGRSMIWNLDDAKNQHQTSEKLAGALSHILPVDTPVIDFGCGRGTYLKHLSNEGFECYGYEGTPNINDISDFKGIQPCDLSKPFEIDHKGSVMCLEVAEHIPKEYESILLHNIATPVKEWFIISWAVKGQGGFGHVNEQNADYVIKTIEKLGFKHQPETSSRLRMAGGSDLWWFKKSIYVFKRLLPR